MWCSGQKIGFGREDLNILFGARVISLVVQCSSRGVHGSEFFQGKRGIPTAFPFLHECCVHKAAIKTLLEFISGWK